MVIFLNAISILCVCFIVCSFFHIILPLFVEWRMSDQQPGVGPTPPTGPPALNVTGQTVRIQQVPNINLLTTGGQQFVITGQVPGLAQVSSHGL